jgi:hypothetical protein
MAIKPLSEKSLCPQSYQQALDDFGLTELLSHLSNYVNADFNAALMNLKEPELESLGAILIQRLIKTLTGKLIASYLNAIRYGDADVLSDPIPLTMPLASQDLPADFPKGITPGYAAGDRVRWRSLNNHTDWGVVMGRFYPYAPHLGSWSVAYLIRLDQDSPSAPWTVTDMAWEDDLEPMSLTSPYDVDPLSPKSFHTSSDDYSPGENNISHPQTLTSREQNLIDLYSNCQLGMTPRGFYQKWSVNYEQIARICLRSTSTVQRWFARGGNYRRPTTTDLRHLGLMDFLLEHFEEIPAEVLELLCPPNSSRE